MLEHSWSLLPPAVCGSNHSSLFLQNTGLTSSTLFRTKRSSTSCILKFSQTYTFLTPFTIYQVIDMRWSRTTGSCDVPQSNLQALAWVEDLMLHLYTQVTALFMTDCFGCYLSISDDHVFIISLCVNLANMKRSCWCGDVLVLEIKLLISLVVVCLRKANHARD